MPTQGDTTTRERLCDASHWPKNGQGERHKPISLLLSYAGKHKHLGAEATAADHIHLAMRVVLDGILRRVDKVRTGSFISEGTAIELAALELAICVLENTEPDKLTEAQQAWERKEYAR